MFTAIVSGYLGSDAKETQKGYSFPVSTKQMVENKETNIFEEQTLWINCFQNFKSKVFPHLKKGKLVNLVGDMVVTLYTDDTGRVSPSVTMNVFKIQLLSPSKKQEQQ